MKNTKKNLFSSSSSFLSFFFLLFFVCVGVKKGSTFSKDDGQKNAKPPYL